MLADIYQAPLPQKRLNCVLQFGYVPPLKRVVIIYVYIYIHTYIHTCIHIMRGIYTYNQNGKFHGENDGALSLWGYLIFRLSFALG